MFSYFNIEYSCVPSNNHGYIHSLLAEPQPKAAASKAGNKRQQECKPSTVMLMVP